MNRLQGEVPTSDGKDQGGGSRIESSTPSSQQIDGLVNFIRSDIIGKDACFNGPFGDRKIVYADYTASSKALKSIEDYINNEVLPLYANSHSSVTITAEQTTLFYHEAREQVRNYVRSGDGVSVIFCGSGATSAVAVLKNALNLITDDEGGVTLVHSPFEHHSNLLPWKDSVKKSITVRETENGSLDLEHLMDILKKESKLGKKVIGCFTAVSNITGVKTDLETVAQIVHSYGGLCLCDYASGAHSMPINFATSQMDALYFSGHKFIGAVSSPGVLVARKELFQNQTPLKGGGGSVFFVSENDRSYLKEPEFREEGGTPEIVGAIRLAISMRLLSSIGLETIQNLERENFEYMTASLQSIPNLDLLGPSLAGSKPIFSFLIRCPTSVSNGNTGSLFLHHNFVGALLDNLFGIQVRLSSCFVPIFALSFGLKTLVESD